MIWIVTGGATALVAGGLVVRSQIERRRREERTERRTRNRARQFGWDMVFGRKSLRIRDHRGEPDPE